MKKICMYMSTYVHTYIQCIYICKHIHITCTHTHKYVYVYIFMYVYKHIYTYTYPKYQEGQDGALE